MRTNVTLESIHRLIEGQPSRTRSSCSARTWSTIRAAGRWRCGRSCRTSAQAWVVDPAHGDTARPMRRIHPAGLVRGDLSLRTQSANSRRVSAPRGRRRQARRTTMHDPYAFPHLLTDYDLSLAERRPALAELQPAGRAAAHGRRRRGRELRRLGPQRHRRERRRRLQQLGRPPPPDAQAHPQRLLGTVRARAWARARSTSTRSATTTRCSRSPIPYGFAAEVPPRTASKVADLDRYHWHDADWMARRPRDQLARAAAVVLRSPPGQLAAARRRSHALADLSRAGPPAGRLLQGDGLHAPRAAAGQRASVLGKLGLSDGRLLRGHQPLRHAAGLHVLRRSSATRTASA